jgi:Sulfatase
MGRRSTLARPGGPWIAIGTVALGVALEHAVASVQASPGVTQVAQRPAASAVSAAAPGAPRGPIVVRTATEAHAAAEQVAAAGRKPNILVMWGDDIGVHNISAYSNGIMGYRTPNIDRIAKERALFTDAYPQQSCTAGRASFILGQEPFRTGLLTIGLPGSDHGIPAGRRRLPICSRRRATRPASSARTTWAIATSTCPPRTASTSSSAPLSPECRRGARGLLLPEGSGVQEEVRPARRDPLLCRRPH